MGYHIKTTPEQEQRLRDAVGTPANPATDAAVVDQIVKLVYRYLIKQEAKDAVKVAKAGVASAVIQAGVMHQQEIDLKLSADLALAQAMSYSANADTVNPGPDWDQ